MQRGRSSTASPVHSRRRCRPRAAAAAAARASAVLFAAALPVVGARAGVATWNPANPTGPWSNPDNWTLSQLPVAGDEVHLDSFGPDEFDANYDLATSAQFGPVYLQYSPTATGRFNLRIDDPARVFAAGGLYVGFAGDARVLHTAGNAQITNDMTLGGTAGGSGAYELGGNATLSTGGQQTLGGAGNGSFLQSGGTNTVGGDLRLLSSDQTSSVYTLAAGRLNVARSITLTSGSNTLFNQTGGVATAAQVVVGRSVASIGTYNLSGGSLALTNFLDIGSAGSGLFVFSGGTLTAPVGVRIGMQSGSAGVLTVTNGVSLTGLGSLTVGVEGVGVVEHYSGVVSVAAPTSTGALTLGYGYGNGLTDGTYNLRNGATLNVIGDEYVGGFGSGTVNQTGGNHFVSGMLYLAHDSIATGTYNMSGGTLNANLSVGTSGGSANFYLSGGSVVSGTATIGDNGLLVVSNSGSFRASTLHLGVYQSGRFRVTGGTATLGDVLMKTPASAQTSFEQTGGDVVVNGYLEVGTTGYVTAPASAVYRISGGNLRVKKQAYAGFSTPGQIIQDGGNVAVDDILFVGTYRDYIPGEERKYTLNGGTLNARLLIIAYTNGASGTYVQNGGAATFDGIEFYRGNGRFVLAGGTVTTRYFNANYWGGSSVVDHTGGTLNVGTNSLALGIGTNTTTVYNISGSAALNLNTALSVGVRGTATFNQTGGAVALTGPVANLFISEEKGGKGVYNISAGSLSVAQSAFIGDTDAGSFNQSGGTVNINHVFVGNATFVNGVYNMSGGSLTAGQIDLGMFGVGTFNQTNGAVVAPRLNVATFMDPSRGTYNLRGGTYGGAEIILGFSGSGAFNQFGGAATLSERIVIGNQGSQTSSFTLAGGTLDVPTITVGQRSTAAGVLNISGGTANVTTELIVGYTEFGSGTANVTAGRLTVPKLFVGYTNSARGVFNQSGGTVSAATTMVGGNDPNTDGRYNLSGGRLAANNAFVGQYGRGVFNQTGGTHNLQSILAYDGLFLGSFAGAYGTYLLSGSGTLYNNVDTYVGYGGRGEFFQSGGSSSASYFHVGGTSGGSGTVTLSAGSLTARQREFVGAVGTGSVLQTGGTHTVGLTLSVGSNTAGSGGTFLLQGGSLTVPAIDVNPTGAFYHTGGTLNATSLTLRGGTVTLGGGQNWAPGATLTASGGNIAFNSETGAPDAPATLAIDLTDATATFNADLHFRAVRLAGTSTATLAGQHLISTDDFKLEGAATLDLGRGTLIVSYGTNAASLIPIHDAIRAGYADGGWNGPGLISTAAADDASLAIGSDDVAGIGGNFLLLRVTLAGDATLDGAVNFEDLVRLAQNYNADGDWAQGDFNYDGVVNFADLVKLAQSYNAALPSAEVPGASASFSDDLAAAFASVPEPSTGAILVLSALGFAWPRPRRRRR
jgi:hypothetical protein